MLEHGSTFVADFDAISRPLEEAARKLERIATVLKKHKKMLPEIDLDLLLVDSHASPEGRLARSIVRQRRLRDQMLGIAMFGEPAWDMLLDLFVAHEEKVPISVSSLGIAAAVPNSTALRWITLMVAEGILVRRNDPDDGRRTWISLAPHMVNQMRRLLRSWALSEQTDWTESRAASGPSSR